MNREIVCSSRGYLYRASDKSKVVHGITSQQVEYVKTKSDELKHEQAPEIVVVVIS